MGNQKQRKVEPAAQRIKELCLIGGISYAELSRRTGIATQSMQRWFSGDTEPALESVRACALALEVPVSSLLTDEGEVIEGRQKQNAEEIERYIDGPLGRDLNDYERAQLRLSRVWVPGARVLDTREIHSIAELIRTRMRNQASLPLVLNPQGSDGGKPLKR